MNHLFRIITCLLQRLILSLLPGIGIATELAPFTDNQTGRLFTAKGSNTVGAVLMPSLAADYFRAKGLVNIQTTSLDVENTLRVQGYHPHSPNTSPVFIDIAAHGSSTGFRGLAEGHAELAMASRPIKANELESLRHMGDMTGFSAEKVIAIDGLAIIVHPANSLSALSVSQVAKVFSGRLTNWKSLGGPDLPISVFARDQNSGTWDTFKNLVLANTYSLAANATRFESNNALSQKVASQPGAIGFVGLASINNTKALSLFDAGTEPLAPSIATVATEDYLLARRLFLYLNPQSRNSARDEFIDFVLSDAGQQRVQQVGYVSQQPTVVTPDLNGIDNAEYLDIVAGAERLSMNIRFRQGSAELDNKALQDIMRLAKLKQSPGFTQKTLFLIGFGDKKNSASRALVLSKLRATRVKTALYNLGVRSAPVHGFGAIIPVSRANKTRNQRVEIWLK